MREHQRRQIKARAQAITDTGRAFDGHALVLQVGHIAVHRALGYFEALRQKRRRGQAPATDQLDNLKQAVGAAHRQERGKNG